jgi:hypothetical protein
MFSTNSGTAAPFVYATTTDALCEGLSSVDWTTLGKTQAHYFGVYTSSACSMKATYGGTEAFKINTVDCAANPTTGGCAYLNATNPQPVMSYVFNVAASGGLTVNYAVPTSGGSGGGSGSITQPGTSSAPLYIAYAPSTTASATPFDLTGDKVTDYMQLWELFLGVAVAVLLLKALYNKFRIDHD